MEKTKIKSSSGGGRQNKSLSLTSNINGTILRGSKRPLNNSGKKKNDIATFDCFYKSSPQPLVVFNTPTRHIIYANPAFFNLYGYSKKESSGLTVNHLFDPLEKESIIKKCYKQLQRTYIPVNANHVIKNGSRIKVQLYSGTVEVNGDTYNSIYIADITEKTKQLEEKRLSQEVNLAIGKGKTFKGGLSNALNTIRGYVGCDLAELWLFSKENDYALVEASSYRKKLPLLKKFVLESETLRITTEQIIQSDIYVSRQPVWIKNLEKQPVLIRSEEALKSGMRLFIMLPILDKETLVGGLFLFDSVEKEFNKNLVDILSSAVINQLCTQIINRRAFDELQSFFQLSGDLQCITGMNRCFININQSFGRILGFTERELLGRNFMDFVHEDDRPQTEEGINGLVKKNAKNEFINRFRCGNGEYKWLSWWMVFSADYQVLLAGARDITDSKKSMEELSKKDLHIHEIFNRISDSFIALDNNYGFAYVNQKAAEILGHEAKELLGKVLWDVFPAIINTPFYHACQEAFNEQRYVFIEDYYKAYDRWYESYIYPSLQGISVYFRDVTEKKKAAKVVEEQNIALRDAHLELQEIVENASEIIFKLDEKGFFLFVSSEFKRSLGYEPNEVIGKHFESFVHPDDLSICQNALIEVLQSRLPSNNIIYRARRKDGLYEWFSTSASFIFKEDGTPKYGIGLSQNITGLRKTVEKLEATEQRYSAFLEQSSEAIWRIEIVGGVSVNAAFEEILKYSIEHGYLAECNLAFSRMYGYDSPQEMEGLLLSEIMPVDNPDNVNYFTSFVKANFKLTNAESVEFDINGNLKYILNNLVGIIENGKLIRIWGTQRDITNKRKAQEELIYKDKLLSVIAEAANSLLKEENYNNIIPGILQNLGTVTSSDRAYIFEKNTNVSGQVTARQIYEWCADGIMTQIKNPTLQNIPFKILEGYFKGLKEGVSFSSPTDKIVDKAVREFLELQNIKSVLVVPIFVNQELWGIVGFDDCRSARLWSEVDKGILNTFVSSLASAIERKKAGEVIVESEARFRQMADTAPVMIWVSDEENNTIYVNKSWLNFTGVSLESINKSNWLSMLHPDDVQGADQEFNQKRKEQLPVILEYRLKSAIGEYRWVIDQAIPRLLADGTFLGYIGSIMDIHDRKLSEEKVSYQALVMQEVTEAIISTDLDFNVITWNKGAEKIHSVSAPEIIGKPLRTFIIYNYLSETRDQALQHLYTYGYWAGDIYFDRTDGRRIYLNCALSFITSNKGVRVGIVGVYRDITDRRKSEEALRISEERHRSVVQALGEGIMLHDRRGKVITTNRSAETILGLSADQILENSPIDSAWVTIHEDGSPFPQEQHPSLITLQTGQSLQNIIAGIHKADGSLTWISINTEPLYYSDQRVTPDAVVSSFIDITQKKTAQMELQRNEQQLREYSDRINNILDSITDGFIAVDNQMKVFLWNRVFEKNTGLRSIEAIGRKVTEVFPDLPESVYDQFVAALRENRTVVQDYFVLTQNSWFETTAFPSSQGLFIYFRDVTKRKRQESLLALEKEVLELNARSQASLINTTDFLLEGIEKIFPGIIGSVICLQDDGKTMEILSAPSLPAGFRLAINESIVGGRNCDIGSALYVKQNVIVEDIANDESWKLLNSVAAQYELRACWSFPILSSQGKVLASFSLFHKQVKGPSAEEMIVFERTVNILRVIIENKQSEEKIKVSNERYLLATMATNDAIWDWDVATNNMYWGEGFHGLFGYKAGYFDRELGIWEASIHPQDKERVVESIQLFVASNSQQVWQEEYRFRKADGKYVLVADRGFLIYNQQGKVSRMVGSMQDISEKREMEKKLLNQELNKQKLVAQAVVDAQEKERSMIGKELHDNINQILSTAKLYLEVARTDNKERDSLIDMSTHSISNAINEIRTISRSLVPSSIGDLGLVDSIQDLVESIKLTRKLNVEFYHHSGIDELMDEPQKLMLFRITQEQVNNVIKHANAKNLLIELIAEEDAINISISDDGQGFDSELVKQNKGLGLSNITSRAELFNGKVKIDTAPGKGCTLNIYIPILNL